MHMADALISTGPAVVMYAASTGAAAWSVKKVKLENNAKMIPVMGVMGAFVFAAQMLNFTIPGTGASGHLCGGMMLSALLGPAGGFLTMIGVLLLQCLIFADGGVLALGANIWNMAFYGCFVGSLLIWRPMMRSGASKKKIITASLIGCVVTLQMGAFSVVLETMASGITELPFALFAGVMQPIHLVIGLVEGMITSAVLVFIYEARPEMLWGIGSREGEKKARLGFGRLMVVLVLMAIVMCFGISRYASENPDGLEWSIEKMTGSTELESHGLIYEIAEKIQNVTAIFPDYALKDSGDGEGVTENDASEGSDGVSENDAAAENDTVSENGAAVESGNVAGSRAEGSGSMTEGNASGYGSMAVPIAILVDALVWCGCAVVRRRQKKNHRYE